MSSRRGTPRTDSPGAGIRHRRPSVVLLVLALVVAGHLGIVARPAGAATPPTISTVTPNSGPAAGGTPITITGAAFLAGSSVTIDGAVATDIVVVDPTSITATTPAHNVGAVDVVVSTVDGTATCPACFNYATGGPPPTPRVSSVSPASGSTAGGAALTLNGRAFKPGTSLTIGGVAATNVVVVNPTLMTAKTAVHAAGAVDIVTSNDLGTGTCAGCFTYVAPAVTAISPHLGSISGGTPVTLTGTGFTTGDNVTIGGVPATNIVVTSPTSINAKTGAHAEGAVDVVVANRGDRGTCTGCFTYDNARQDGDLFVGSASVVDGYGSTAGGVWRVRGTTATLFCASPESSFDPGFWNVPDTLIVDSKGRIVFLAPIGYQEMGLLRCDQPGMPAEHLGAFHLRELIPAGWPDPFPGLRFGVRMGYLHVLGQRVITDDLQSAPKINNEDSYEFVVQVQNGADPTLPGATEMIRYGADSGEWLHGADLPGILQNGNLVSVIAHGDDLYSFNGQTIRRTSMPYKIGLAGSVGGVDFKFTYTPFGGQHEVAGISDDTQVPNVSSGCNTDPPGKHDDVTDAMPWVNGFVPFGGDRLIYDEHGGLGLVVKNTYGPMPGPYLTQVSSALLNDDPMDDVTGYFHQPYDSCRHVPWIQFTSILPWTSPGSTVAFDNVADVIATAPGGMVGTSFWGNSVLRLAQGDKASQIVTLYHPGGIAAYPAIVPSLGTVVYITVHSPVDVLLTDTAGRRIGVDPATGIAVNDFGPGGFDSGAGEPRVFAIKNPAPGAFTLSSVGTGTGPYRIDVAYAGFNTTLSSRVSATGTAAVGAAGTHDFVLSTDGAVSFVAPSTQGTATSLSSSVNPSLVDQPVTFTATVTAASGIPTGAVRFTVGATAPSIVNLDATGKATVSFPSAAAGGVLITADYLGDPGFAPSSDSLTQTVGLAGTVTTVTSSKEPSTLSEQITITAHVVAASGTGTPTGSVTFTDGPVTLGTASLAGNDAAITLATLALGDHSIGATYGGSSSFAASTSASIIQTVQRVPTGTVVVSSSQPAVFGQPVTWTAAVSAAAPAAGVPTGTVTFADGSTVLGSITLVAGQAGVTSAALTIGVHTITASYGGDATYASSDGSFSQTIAKAATTTVVTSSGPTIYGQSVTFTATVAPAAPGSGGPSGTVSFAAGSAVLGTSAVTGGVATFTTAALGAGTYSVTATYGGDASFLGSANAAALTQAVSKAASTTTLTSSPAIPTAGQLTTFSASVSSGAGTPTGAVTFTDGAALLGVATLSGGVATLTSNALAVGAHAITAAYQGDANFLASVTATPLAVTVTGIAATTTLTLGFDISRFTPDSWVPLTVTVRPVVAGSPITGTVQFFVTAPNGRITRTVASVGPDGIARSRQRIDERARYRFTAVFTSTSPSYASSAGGPVIIDLTKPRGGPVRD